MNISNTTIFAALLPDDAFDEKLRSLKSRVLSLVGPQLYLDHTPHLTLYLASFPSVEAMEREVEQWAGEIAPPQLSILGWHVFRGDALTGQHSLVCQLRPEDEASLRLYQGQLVRRIAPLRDGAACARRFEPSRHNLSPAEWKSVETCGFPYVGSLWRPHFTVASIRPADWDKVWNELAEMAPTGPVSCPTLGLYRLRGEHPEELRSFRLGERP